MLKSELKSLDEAPETVREHYAMAEDGTFRLVTDEPKIGQFRDRNIALTKEVAELRPLKAKFAEIDPDAVKADRQRLKDLEATNASLTTDLAAERAARAAAQQTADASVLKTLVGEAFIKVGGRPKALDYIVGKAVPVFTVKGGALVSAQFSPTQPGVRLTVDEWLVIQIKESDFAFNPSQGGGANPSRPGAATSTVRELRNPTPAELGRHAREIALGQIKVV